MSIKIGDGTLDWTNAATTRERLVLSSTNNSNLVQISSGTGNIQFQLNDYTFGKYGPDIQFRNSINTTTPFARFSPNGHTLNGQTNINGILNASSFGTAAVFTSNIYVLAQGCNVSPNTSIFRVQRQDGSNIGAITYSDLLNIQIGGSTYIQGPIGVGTTIPRDYVDINSNLYVSKTTTTSNIITTKIQRSPNTNHAIEFTNNSILLRGTIEALDQLTVRGGFNFDGNLMVNTLTASDTIFGKRGYLYNQDISIPTLDIIYDGPTQYYRSSNATIENIAPKVIDLKYGIQQTSQRNIFNIDATGKIGIGTNIPQGQVCIEYSSSNFTPNMLAIHGENEHNKFFVDMNANVGIGTSQPKNNIHIERTDDNYTYSPINSFIGLYQNDLLPIITFDNANSNIYWLSNIDGLTASNFITDSNIWWNNILVGSNAGSNFAYGSNLISYLITQSNYQSPSPFLSCYSNHQQVFAIDFNGGLRINCSNIDTQYLLNVEGKGHLDELEVYRIVGDPNTSNINFVQTNLSNIDDISAKSASISNIIVDKIECNYMYTSNYEIEGLQCFSTTSEFNITLDKFLFTGSAAIFGDVMIDSHDLNPNLLNYNAITDGKLKIEVASPLDALDVSRGINIIGQQNTGLRVYSANRRSLIELATPVSTGKIQMQSNELLFSFNSDDALMRLQPLTSKVVFKGATSINSSGYIGIGTDPLSTPLMIKGNMHILDTTGISASVFYVDSSTKTVAINTNSPSTGYNLHVAGTTLLTSTVQFNTNMIGFGNIGIGTTSPTAQIHIYAPTTNTHDLLRIQTQTKQSVLSVRTNGNIGIGTTNPAFLFHVAGDLNFDGNLFQGGGRYVSSQWTTQPGTSNIFITDGNVGIGTNIALYALHVGTSNAYFGSNITVGNNVYARGSFVSTSDRTLKTDLIPITEAMHKINTLNGYTYHRLDTGKRDAGLIAQEVEKILPEVVSLDDKNLLTIAYGNMAGLFVEAFKDMQKQINDLKDELYELKSSIQTIV